MFPAVAMLSHGGRWWGDRDNDDGKEEEVEEDNNRMTIAVSGRRQAKWQIRGVLKEDGILKEDGNADTMAGGEVVNKIILSFIFLLISLLIFC